ncbi:MAG: serine hydrolase domain-containing protein [Moraxellaceae bacterium]|nr:serine hydrolase domain-containing protein [Moraxellaceae bacterium]
MKLLSTNTCRVPADLGSVTTIDYDKEVPAELGGLTSSQAAAIWSAVEALYKTGFTPAITFCLRRHGKIVFNRSIGHARGNGPEDAADTPKQLATPDTPICLFSASKVVTAMLVHKLDEDGLIDLLDPVSHYIPEYGVNGKRNATIYHLLAHRGGIPRLAGDFDPELLYDVEAIVQELCKAEAVSMSGYRAAYHAITAGYILGELVERVTGMSLREYLHQTFREPLGMRYFDYGVQPQDRAEVAVNYCTGLKPVPPISTFIQHVLGGSLEMATDMTNDPRFMDTICPAGNLYATAEESSRFFQMLLNGGEYEGTRIFDPRTIRRATIEVSRPEFDATLLVPMRYSMGMMLGNKPVGLYGPYTKRAFGHLGFTSIFCWADPDRDTSVSILTSGKALVGPHLPALGKLLMAISRECPIVRRPKPVVTAG